MTRKRKQAAIINSLSWFCSVSRVSELAVSLRRHRQQNLHATCNTDRIHTSSFKTVLNRSYMSNKITLK